MAKKASDAAKARKTSKSVKEQINGIDPEQLRETFDTVHDHLDHMEESNAALRGKINAVYEKACDRFDVSKEALKMVFSEERSTRKKAAKAAKMNTRAADSFAKISQALGDSPMSDWAKEMGKLAGSQSEAE